MGRVPYGGFPELAPPLLLQPGEVFIVQEASRAKRAKHLPQDLAHVKLAGRLHKQRPQIKFGVLPIEAREALEQLRRDQKRRIGVAERVPDQESRALRIRRGHEVQLQPEAR
jgi:hypothetical protein